MDARKVISHCLSRVRLDDDLIYIATEIDGDLLMFANMIEKSTCEHELRISKKDDRLIAKYTIMNFNLTSAKFMLLYWKDDLGYTDNESHNLEKIPNFSCNYKLVLFMIMNKLNILPTLEGWLSDTTGSTRIPICIVGEKLLRVGVNYSIERNEFKLSLPNNVNLLWDVEDDEYWAEQGFEPGYVGYDLSKQIKTYYNLFSEYLHDPKSATK